jgi:NTP-dependent ternary system trypsin peptidase co-occuring protein
VPWCQLGYRRGLLSLFPGGGAVAQEPWAELGETISAIRSELQAALDEGRDEAVQFTTGPVELEFSVEVRKDGGANAKVFVLPWTVEAHASAGVAQTHRIKLTLQPVNGHGDDLRIAGESDCRPL